MVPTHNNDGNDDHQKAQRVTGLHLPNADARIDAHDFASSSGKVRRDLPTPGSDDEREADDRRGLLQPRAESRPAVTQQRLSLVEEDEPAADAAKQLKGKPVTWMSLPKKDQLAVLTFARLAEPLTERGLQAYLFYQLKWFDPTLPDSTISGQAGMLSATFAAAQCFTAILWGRAADSPRFGRKRVIMIGLSGTLISILGIGFSKTYAQAIVFRTIGGAVNGNVGVMRTMISEIISDKKYQSRAFLLLPMCFNIGIIIGPILGGFFADPVKALPSLFGEDSLFGGKDGVGWMKNFPYALPNLVSVFIIFGALMGITLGLDETHQARKHRTDWGREFGRSITRFFDRWLKHRYSRLPEDEFSATGSIDIETHNVHSNAPDRRKPPSMKPPARIPFYRIFTLNVALTLVTHFILAFHVSTFNSLIFILLPAPRSPDPPPQPHNLFRFTGGLGLSSSRVGLATAIIGFIGLPLQLFLYPRLHSRFGTLKCYRLFLPFSPIAYTLIPYLTLLPASKYFIWPALVIVLGLQVISRTFALPGTVILINNSSPSPSVLGTIHGVAQSVSSAARSLGPLLGGWGLGLGLRNNIVGAVWWALAIAAFLGWAISWAVYEGGGDEEED